MNPTNVLDEVKSWPVDDQLDLVFRLWDQLVDSGWQPELTDELRSELDRRLDAHAADPSNVLSWDQVVERVRRKK